MCDTTLNDFNNHVLSNLPPNEEEFPRKCGQEDRAAKEAWEKQANEDVI
jgi:hypothetical protein